MRVQCSNPYCDDDADDELCETCGDSFCRSCASKGLRRSEENGPIECERCRGEGC